MSDGLRQNGICAQRQDNNEITSVKCDEEGRLLVSGTIPFPDIVNSKTYAEREDTGETIPVKCTPEGYWKVLIASTPVYVTPMDSEFVQLWRVDGNVLQTITISPKGRKVFEAFCECRDNSGFLAERGKFYIDVSADGTNWIMGYTRWIGVSQVKEVFISAFRYIRLRSFPTGTAGDTVTLILIFTD